MLSNRTLVYPDPPCAAAWMLQKHNTSACDGSAGLVMAAPELMPYAALDDPAAGASSSKSFRFASPYILNPGCVRGSDYTGMLNVEFEHWLLHDAPTGTAKEPDPTNIAFLRGHSIVLPTKEKEPTDWSVGEVIVKLPIAEAFIELRRLDSSPLVYVSQPVVVDFLTDREQSSHISSLSNIERGRLEMLVNTFHDTYLKECRYVFEHPWMWNVGRGKYIGRPEHVVGLAGYMRDDGVHVEDGATFPDGRKKPWTEEDLEEPAGSPLHMHGHKL
eukprot:gene610-2039_t